MNNIFTLSFYFNTDFPTTLECGLIPNKSNTVGTISVVLQYSNAKLGISGDPPIINGTVIDFFIAISWE